MAGNDLKQMLSQIADMASQAIAICDSEHSEEESSEEMVEAPEMSVASGTEETEEKAIKKAMLAKKLTKAMNG